MSSINPKLAVYLPFLEGITNLFYPHVEAALHDLQTGKIAALYNNISRRAVGDPSAVSKFISESVESFPDVFEPYYKDNWDGKKFKCVSVTIRGDDGKPIGLACFNFDASVFKEFGLRIEQLLAVSDKTAQNPVEQFTENWQQRVNECVDNFLKESHTTLNALSKEQKRDVTNRLYNHGLFNYRRAAAYIADQLDVSRATVYNYLKEG